MLYYVMTVIVSISKHVQLAYLYGKDTIYFNIVWETDKLLRPSKVT